MCDKELLVGYLYDDVDAVERRATETHLLSCGECRAELKDLRSTRTRLSAWVAPAPELAFEILQAAPPPSAPPPPRAGYWSISPAWGLAAAAMLVLSVASAIANIEVKYGADGLTLRTGAARTAAAPEAAPAVARSSPPAAAPDETLRRELQAMSRRLSVLESGAEARPVLTSAHTSTTQPPPADLLRAVRQLISESENRQQTELALRISQVLRDVEGARRVDYDRTQRALAEVQGVADTTIMRQREMQNILRVVQSPR